MSEKTKIPFGEAMSVALLLKERLAPFCERVEIAGSLRREKPMVSDIEMLYIPRFEDRPVDMFTSAPCNLVDDMLGKMMDAKEIEKRPNVNGQFTWGEKNKLARHVGSGIPVDFFATTEANWWVSLVVRTGSKEMNLELTNGAIQRGRNLVAYGSGVRVSNGDIIPATSEREVFELCGVRYREPNER